MRFTVFGADGFVGKSLVSRLVVDGHEVLTPDREQQLDSTTDLGHVIYCIGVTGSDFLTKQFKVVEAHVSLISQVLENCTFSSLVYMSSARMYEGLQSTAENSVFQASTENISDFYNLSKLFGESIVLNCGVENTRVVRVAYAVNLDENSTNFVAVKAREAAKGKVVFQAHRDSVKDYVLLDDVVSLLPKITISGRERVYNIASGVNISTLEIANLLKDATGCSVELLDSESCRKPMVIDISRIRNEFGFQPTSVLDYARTMLLKDQQ